jgi:hypothetical protein
MIYNWKNRVAIMICAVILSSCDPKAKVNTNTNPNASQHNQDVSNIKSENDNVNTDVNNAMTSINGFAKNGAVQQNEALNICGATIDSSHQRDPQPYIVIHFDGSSTCGNPGRVRSGDIKVQLVSGSHWFNAGAVLLLTYTNYKVSFPSQNNQSLTFNGLKYLTDVSGIDGVSYFFTGALTASFKERTNNMQVLFDNNSLTSDWNSARTITYDIVNYNNITGTINADTTVNGIRNIDSWGQTRFGTKFTTQMIQPWKSGTACGWWNPIQGQYTSTTDSFTVTALLGVNSSGNQVSSGCAYGFKLNWSFPTHPTYDGTAIIQYW